jgi:hypothetical protein
MVPALAGKRIRQNRFAGVDLAADGAGGRWTRLGNDRWSPHGELSPPWNSELSAGNHTAIAIDESTGKVFLDADCLARSNGSLEKPEINHLPKFLTCSI